MNEQHFRKAALRLLLAWGYQPEEIARLTVGWALDRVCPYVLDAYLDYRPELRPEEPLFIADSGKPLNPKTIGAIAGVTDRCPP